MHRLRAWIKHLSKQCAAYIKVLLEQVADMIPQGEDRQCILPDGHCTSV